MAETTKPDITPAAAVDLASQRGPTDAAVFHDLRDSILNVAETTCRLLPRGQRVLDFGAGGGEKAAVLGLLGYDVVAVDDMGDPWHTPEQQRAVKAFTARCGVDYRLLDGQLPDGPFDMVMLHSVLEHLHDSPRTLLNSLLEQLREGGLLFITVPNAGNLRKRIALLRGGTNLPRFASYYWYPDPFRGHVREYVQNDLEMLAWYLGLSIVELCSSHEMLMALPGWAREPWRKFTRFVPGFRDSWALVARKPPGWTSRASVSDAELSRILGHSGVGSPWRTGRPDCH